jgi:hypothetical protein
LTHATGTAERDVVKQLPLDAQLRDFHPRTVGADKAYAARAIIPLAIAHSSALVPRRTAHRSERQSTPQRD